MPILTSLGRALIASGRILTSPAANGAEPETPGVGSITLAEPVDRLPIQQEGGSAPVPVSVAITGDVSLVEVRAVPIALNGTLDESKATAWTTISTSAQEGTAGGTVQIPEGGWYVWQARDKLKTGIKATGANRFGVGDVLLWIGQSNAANSPDAPEKYPSGDERAMEDRLTGSPLARVLRRVGKYADTKPPNTLFSGTGGYGSASTGQGSTGDGYVFFANLFSQARNVPVLLVNRAVGGTSIEQWLATGGLLDQAIAAVNNVGGKCRMVIWYQGEANADSATSEASYRASLGTLHTRLKTAFGPDIKLGIAALAAIGNSTYTDGTETQVPAIRRAQIGYANETPGAFLAATGLDLRTGADAVHLNAASYSISGRRQVKSALAAVGIGTSGAGPRVASGTRSGLTVDVTLAHTGGTALADGAGGTGASLKGFRFFDDGTPLAHTMVGIVGADKVRMTLASLPTGVLTMDFGQANASFHTDPNDSRTTVDMASVLYDNAYYHGSSITAPFALSTVGCPLQPCPAITINGS